MRILMLDLDTLRPDHLGCYGYARNTSPHIDRIASQGMRFNNYYVSDAPCLPSRSALTTGQFGIHNGVVNHGGTNADPMPEGPHRGFRQQLARDGLFSIPRRVGLYTASISSFAERHSAWQFNAGLNEMYNPFGRGGNERADEVLPTTLDWLDRNRGRDEWFLHVNMWDPHTPYRTPLEYGNPFQNDPAPDWITQETIDRHRASFGTHSAADVLTCSPGQKLPRLPEDIRTIEDFRKWIDAYDTGIRYMDDAIGRILEKLAGQGLLDETIILVTSDHGENQGELNIYGDHQTADHVTGRIPMIVRWPGVTSPGSADDQLHYQVDLLPTLADLLNTKPSPRWDGLSYAGSLKQPGSTGHDFLVLSQMAWSCQRAVRWDKWVLIRTYHAGFKDFPPVMLFDVQADPHEEHDLSEKCPDVVAAGLAILEHWHSEQMAKSPVAVDPMQTVLREGGPLHTRDALCSYCAHLRNTGRAHHAERLEAQYGATNWK